MKEFRKKAFLFLKVLISIALVGLVVSKIGFADLAASLKTVNLHFVPALLCALLFTYLKVLKWHGLVLAASVKASPRAEAAKSYLVGLACGLVTPARMGELARMIYLENHSQSLIAYLAVVDRVFDLVVVLSLALAGLVYFASPVVVAAMAGVVVLLLAMIFFPACPLRCLQHVLERSGRYAAAQRRLSVVAEQITGISSFEKWKLLGISFFCYGVVIWQFYHLLNNYHHGGLWIAVRVQPLIMLTNILPFTIAGLGFREGAAMFLLSPFGVPQAAAISSAFILFLLNTALPALAGAVLLLLHRTRRAGG